MSKKAGVRGAMKSIDLAISAAVRGLARMPLLTHAGIGSERRKETLSLVGMDGLFAEIAALHDRFLLDLEGCKYVRDEALRVFEWFQPRLNYSKLKSPNTRDSSYVLKHVVESCMGDYVANGTFIAVAVGLGYKITPIDAGRRWIEPNWWSPLNVYFNLSRNARYHVLQEVR